MDLIQAAIYGIVQGLTEWLPISSTAHLRIVPALLGWQDPGAAFTAAIQLGTMFAVLIYFGKDLWTILQGFFAGLTKSDARGLEYKLGWGILIGTLPVIALGLLFKDDIETKWRSLQVVAIALIGMGVLLAVAERFGGQRRGSDQLTMKDGIWVGCWQAIALIPGASRSGSCLTGALFGGLERAAAARFAFLLSVPSVLAAGAYSLYSHRKEFSGELLSAMVVANVFSFIVGFATIAFLMKFLQKRSTAVFVIYRIALGAILLVLIQTGKLDPNAGAPVPAPEVAAR